MKKVIVSATFKPALTVLNFIETKSLISPFSLIASSSCYLNVSFSSSNFQISLYMQWLITAGQNISVRTGCFIFSAASSILILHCVKIWWKDVLPAVASWSTLPLLSLIRLTVCEYIALRSSSTLLRKSLANFLFSFSLTYDKLKVLNPFSINQFKNYSSVGIGLHFSQYS